METQEKEQEVLGWTRDEKGNVVDRHPVDLANYVTAAPRDNTQNYVKEVTACAMRGRDKDNPNDRGKSTENYAQRLEVGGSETSNTVTTVSKDCLVKETAVLTPVRSDYGKKVRRQYGDNNLPESRHNLTRLEPKSDGTSNTLTSVAKDNLLLEQSRRVRVRRLTERELFRLMDVDERDIDTLLNAGIPKTQLAKMAGNSIVVSCLYYLFRNLLCEEQAPENEQLKLF